MHSLALRIWVVEEKWWHVSMWDYWLACLIERRQGVVCLYPRSSGILVMEGRVLCLLRNLYYKVEIHLCKVLLLYILSRDLWDDINCSSEFSGFRRQTRTRYAHFLPLPQISSSFLSFAQLHKHHARSAWMVCMSYTMFSPDKLNTQKCQGTVMQFVCEKFRFWLHE